MAVVKLNFCLFATFCIGVFFSPFVMGSLTCQLTGEALAGFPTEKLTAYPTSDSPHFLKGKKAFLLGTGTSGQVIRVEEGDKVSVIKVYREVKQGWDRDTRTWQKSYSARELRDRDSSILTALRKKSLEQDLGFVVPEIKNQDYAAPEGNHHTIHFEVIQGRDLVSLVNDKTLPPATKRKAVADYIAGIEKFCSSFSVKLTPSKEPYNPDIEKFWTYENFPMVDQSISLPDGLILCPVLIKADGIIVNEADGRQYLVDPN